MRIKNWGNFIFITGYHLALFALIPAYIKVFTWPSLVLAFVTYLLGGLAITVGYHRLFSHNTYKASPLFEWANLFFATLAFESTALRWSSDHRLHHSHVDTPKDPYNIHNGFLYAHILWIFTFHNPIDEKRVKDLMANPRVMFQHKHIVSMSLISNGLVFGLGCLFVSPMESFFAGVLLRMFMIHHCTWFINSLAHTWGSKTYAKEQTAVDNAIMAFLTFGEGYHNYHHAMANDYRNGIRWYHFDPTKWIIWGASKIGMTSKLRKVEKIKLQRLLVNQDKEMILDTIGNNVSAVAMEMKSKLEELHATYDEKAALLMRKGKELSKATSEKRDELKKEIRQLKRELRAQWKEWVVMTQEAVAQFNIAHAHG